MRGVVAAPHRVWRYAVLAWVTLIAGPTGHAAIRWQMGVGRDIDISGVHELVFMFALAFAAPMAALAFGVFAPLAVGIDHIMNGRAPRFVNVILGAALSVPALIVTVMVAGWTMKGVPAVATLQRAMGLIAALPLAGMIVGLGVRHSRSTVACRQPPRPLDQG